MMQRKEQCQVSVHLNKQESRNVRHIFNRWQDELQSQVQIISHHNKMKVMYFRNKMGRLKRKKDLDKMRISHNRRKQKKDRSKKMK